MKLRSYYNIDDIFVSKKFRGKRIASHLIKEFTDRLRKKKINNCRLDVSLKNKNAIAIY